MIDRRAFSLPCRLEALFPEETFTPAVFEATLEALSPHAAVVRCSRVELEELNLVMRETRCARLRPVPGDGMVERFRVSGRIVWVEDADDTTRFGLALDNDDQRDEFDALRRAAEEDAWTRPSPRVETVAQAAGRNAASGWLSLVPSALAWMKRAPVPQAITSRGPELSISSRDKVECAIPAQFSLRTGAAAFDMANFRATITSVGPRGVQATIDEDAAAFRAAMRVSGMSPMKLMHCAGGWIGFDEGGRRHATWARLVWLGGVAVGAASAPADADPLQAGFVLWSDENDTLGGAWALERAANASAAGRAARSA